VVAQDRIQVGFEKSVELVLGNDVLALSRSRLQHVRIHVEAGFALPQDAVIRDDRELPQHHASVGRTVVGLCPDNGNFVFPGKLDQNAPDGESSRAPRAFPEG
jgi:hypothetical protein